MAQPQVEEGGPAGGDPSLRGVVVYSRGPQLELQVRAFQVLMRAFSRVEEDGRIAIPSNIRNQAELEPGSLAEYKVIRIKETSRRPHILFHGLHRSPYTSPMEAVMMYGLVRIDEKGKIVLDDTILDEAKLKPGEQVEMKVMGPHREHWIAAYNRGPSIAEEGRRRRQAVKKQWETVALDY